jgi:hypothetical protein
VKNRWLAPAFVGVVLFGMGLRIVRLHTAPPGLFFDEAANLFDIESILNGARPLYFPANNGREPFFFYWASLFASFLGNTPYSLRLSGAVMGTITLPAVFFGAREMALCWDRDRVWSESVAVASTFVIGITYFHLHYSRFGLRTISLPFFLALSFGFLFRSLRRQSFLAATAAGFFGGLATYTYISARLAPILLVVPLAFTLARKPLRQSAMMVVWIGVVWAIISVPLGVYYVRHPQEIEGHTDDVSILNPANNGGDPVGAVVRGVVATLGAIDVAGSRLSDQNLTGRPIFDPVLSAFFVAGMIALALRPRELTPDAGNPPLPLGEGWGESVSVSSGLPATLWRPLVAVFLIAWILDQAAPSMLSVSPPGFVRLTGILPTIAIVAGIGVASIFRLLCLRDISRPIALAGISAALAISTAWTVRDYFFVWAPGEDAYNWMMAPKVDASNYLKSIAATDRVFLAPLWATDNTIKFMTRGAPIQSFDLGQTLVVPSDQARTVDYFFPASDPQEAAQVASELPVRSVESTVNDPIGRHPLLIRLNLRSSDLPPAPKTLAKFEDGVGLIGATFDQSRIATGGAIQITLQWLSLRASTDDYTIFIHVRDSSNTTIAQADGRPGAGSFPTNSWQPGDLIWDRHRLTVPTNAHPGTYNVVVGLYRLANLKRLAAQVDSGAAPNDEVSVGSFEITPP